jgi:large subunit ribosomal protein L4
MPSVQIIGQNPGSLELSLPKPKTHVLYEVVNWQLAKRRRGTASTQTRAEVSRTGKKLYGQKGTGNARHGDRAAPIYVGGGAAFGPKPRDYEYTLPKKVRKLGLQMAVSDRVSEGKVLAVSGFGLEGKTKAFIAWAAKNGLDGSARVFLVTDDEMVLRAARNLKWVTPVKGAGLNVYDILKHDYLVVDKAVLEAVASGVTAKAEKPERVAREVKLPSVTLTKTAYGEAKAPKAVVKAKVAAPVTVAPKASKAAAPKLEKSKPVKAAPAEVEAAPVEAPKAEAPKAKKAAGGDDLKRVEGIGPKMADALIASGIDTFAKLSESSEEQIKAALEAAGARFAPSLGTWAQQAALLAKGDDAGFKALTDSLTSGRKDGE